MSGLQEVWTARDGTRCGSERREQACSRVSTIVYGRIFMPAQGFQNCKNSQVWVEESGKASKMRLWERAVVLMAFAGINAAKKT
jgi:hypothetical protein